MQMIREYFLIAENYAVKILSCRGAKTPQGTAVHHCGFIDIPDLKEAWKTVTKYFNVLIDATAAD